MDDYIIQPNLSSTFYLLVQFSHCFMDIFSWIPHLLLKISMSTTKLLAFLPSLFGMPPFFKVQPLSQNTLPFPLQLLSHHWDSFICISSIFIHVFFIPSSNLFWLRLLPQPPTQSLGSSLTLSIHPQHCSKFHLVMLLSCRKPFFGLILHSLVFIGLYNMILNDYVHHSAHYSLTHT